MVITWWLGLGIPIVTNDVTSNMNNELLVTRNNQNAPIEVKFSQNEAKL
jgi:hypothetical protein